VAEVAEVAEVAVRWGEEVFAPDGKGPLWASPAALMDRGRA